jgi:cytochrome c-type biogenesis protein
MVELAVKAGLAFVAGGLSFCAPCVLPLIPVYLSFLTGTNLRSGESPGRAAALRQALCFVAGFSLIFIVVLGGAATALGRALYDALPLLRQVGGVLLIVLGLHLIGWLRLPFLYRERRFGLSPGQRASPAAAFLTGIVFAAGWTPCVGPVLAGILALAADERSMARGLLLMACYAAGLGVPFILSALAVERVTAWIRRLGPRLQTVSTVSGVFVAALGVLLLFDVVGLLSRYLPAWEPPL